MTKESTHFKLNLQILADNFFDIFTDIRIFAKSDELTLEDIRFIQKDKPLYSRYIYLVESKDADEILTTYKQGSFLVIGKCDCDLSMEHGRILQILDAEAFTEVYNLAQQTFARYQEWDRRLQLAINGSDPLEEMLDASLSIFHNPIFAHDTNFYLLGCPRHLPGMSVWERDSRTGRLMVPLSLIHDFKTDLEYLRTLRTKGPDIYNEDMRGYRILYMNLWVEGIYEGRICINEMQSSILPGHFQALLYLGTFIELCIKRRNLFHMNMGNDTRQFFADYLDGKISDSQRIQDTLSFLNWKPTDRYLCLRLESDQQDEQMHSSIATIGHIESQVPEGRAFIYQQGIVVVINLSYDHASVSDVISGLAIILREGLFKLGASCEIHDFILLDHAYTQAAAALSLGKKSGSMIWCYRFDDYMLDYIMEESCTRLPPEMISSQKLMVLKHYDEENNTELYHTLETYLNMERNALQTANALYIHRSSLFYRLERIKKLAKVDLDNPRERLMLQISFALIARNQKG